MTQITTNQLREQIGYRQPPIELPPIADFDEPELWTDLRDWFDAAGIDVRNGTEVYLADRFGVDLNTASDLVWRYKNRWADLVQNSGFTR